MIGRLMKLMNWINTKRAEARVRHETYENVVWLKAHGGSDKLIRAVLTYLSDNSEVDAALSAGTLPREKYPADKLLLGTAAVQSMMQARKELLSADLADDQRRVVEFRRDTAEMAFMISWKLIDESDRRADPEERAAFMRDHMREGRQALDMWRRTDPTTFPIIVEVHDENGPTADMLSSYESPRL